MSNTPEVVDQPCDGCDFECGTIGYCIKDGENYIVSKLLYQKGYGRANIDFGFINRKYVPGIELYKRQCKKFMENMTKLGHNCILYNHPYGKTYLSTVIIDNGVQPIELCLDLLELDVIK